MADEADDKLKVSILRDIRREQRETRELLLALTKHVSELGKILSARIDESDKRLSARIDESDKRTAERVAALNDDLILNLKMEVLGNIANVESRIDQKIDELLAH
jgi:hypothetical protein